MSKKDVKILFFRVVCAGEKNIWVYPHKNAQKRQCFGGLKSFEKNVGYYFWKNFGSGRKNFGGYHFWR